MQNINGNICKYYAYADQIYFDFWQISKWNIYLLFCQENKFILLSNIVNKNPHILHKLEIKCLILWFYVFYSTSALISYKNALTSFKHPQFYPQFNFLFRFIIPTNPHILPSNKIPFSKNFSKIYNAKFPNLSVFFVISIFKSKK